MEKRFTTNKYYIYDHFKENEWLVNEVEVEYIVTLMNNLDTKARERSKALSKLQKENEQLKKENKQLKSEIRYFQSKLHNNTMEVRELTLKEVKESIRKLERWE